MRCRWGMRRGEGNTILGAYGSCPLLKHPLQSVLLTYSTDLLAVVGAIAKAGEWRAFLQGM